MSFFKNFKEELTQAVNEMVPEDGLVGEDGSVMVDTITEDEEFELSETTLEENLEKKMQNLFAESEPLIPSSPQVQKQENLPVLVEEIKKEEKADTEEGIDLKEAGQAKELDRYKKRMEEAMNEESQVLGIEKIGADRGISEENAVITESMTIKGDILSDGSMAIHGNVTGNVEIKGKLIINGEMEGNSKASEVYTETAKIKGEIHSSGTIKVGQKSIIVGNISATSAVIAGAIEGNIDVQGPVILDATAVVVGDIKSKSVQINNGAVIEGFCSQCYADVKPNTRFDNLKN